MQKRLEEINNELKGKSFLYREKPSLDLKKYDFIKIVAVAGNIRVDTKQRQFVLKPLEVEKFMNSIAIEGVVRKINRTEVEADVIDEKSVQMSKENEVSIIRKVKVPDVCEKVSEGLLKMFDVFVYGEQTEADIVAAKNASMVAGKLIDIEKVKLGYLMLNNK